MYLLVGFLLSAFGAFAQSGNCDDTCPRPCFFDRCPVPRDQLDDPDDALQDSSQFGGTVTAAPTETEVLLSSGEWRSIQAKLNSMNFQAGPTDGIPGSRTRAAIRNFKEASGLPSTSVLTNEAYAALEQAGTPGWPPVNDITSNFAGRWVYIGIFDGQWYDEGFRWPGWQSGPPRVGETITAIRDTNIRQGRAIWGNNGWSFPNPVGVVKVGQSFTIDRIIDVTDRNAQTGEFNGGSYNNGYYWARVSN